MRVEKESETEGGGGERTAFAGDVSRTPLVCMDIVAWRGSIAASAARRAEELGELS